MGTQSCDKNIFKSYFDNFMKQLNDWSLQKFFFGLQWEIYIGNNRIKSTQNIAMFVDYELTLDLRYKNNICMYLSKYTCTKKQYFVIE